ARDAQIYACVSVTERDGGSLYLSQLWFDPKGDLVGRHRKLRPTGPERYIYGDGDGSMMPVIESPIGNLGGLLCWEHLVPLTSAAMNSMNEQVHVGSWATYSFFKGGPFDAVRDFKARSGALKNSPLDIAPNEIMSRHYAMATQTFVVMSTGVLNEEGARILSEGIPASDIMVGGGGSRIIAPDGSVISPVLPHDEEGLVYADIPLEMVIYSKYMCDPAGHYGVPNVLSLNFNRVPARAVRMGDPDVRPAYLSFEQLQEAGKTDASGAPPR
ncbi:MAG: hypothetical protein IT495_07050, partial [Gammaproteobacteria bacterium]|nr:hypothetical protein [Gammaproteobacteria bacterium]